MPVLSNIGMLAICPLEGGQSEIGPIPNAALAWEGNSLTWCGAEADLPSSLRSQTSFDAGGRLVVPGLIDCHTHLAFGGWRADEFEQRVRGQSYLEIAGSGGGIASTVEQTRAAGEEQLLKRCREFCRRIASLGVTTLECKSGYGLDLETELRLLRVYGRLQQEQPVRIVSTFLGAHVVPPEMRSRRQDYIALLIREMLPRVESEKLASFCDVFVEESAFTAAEAKQIITAAHGHGLIAKLHADQLTDGGGARLAAQMGAVSADHLECVSAEGIEALAEKQVAAVLLPIATLYLGQKPAPARALIEAGVRVALATDFNPGSAPSYHLPLAMTLGCTLLKMTPAEVLKAVTIHAAAALGLEKETGSLEVGKSADFALIDAPDVNHWVYHFRPNACLASWCRGKRQNPGALEALECGGLPPLSGN